MIQQPAPPRSRGPKSVKVGPEHILDAAQVVFARDGLSGSSIRAISREAGCDPALIYYHFESKEAMFSALLERKFPVLLDTVRRLADPSDARHTSERIWEVIQVYRRLLADDAGFRAIIHGEIARGTEGIKDAMAQKVMPVLGSLTELFRQGVERGHLRPDVPPMLCTLFLVRPYIDFLDVVPVMASRVLGLAPGSALPQVEQAWFAFYWRGIALHPEEPLPFLPESRS